MKVRSIIILFAFFTAFRFTQAQMEVQVNFLQPPPNQLRASDVWKLNLFNDTKLTFIIRLEGTIDEAGEGRVVTGYSGKISLPPGSKSITYDDVNKDGSVNFKAGTWREAFTRTGNAPSGNYTICITVKDEAGKELGSDCIQQDVEILSAPTLIAPADGEEIDPKSVISFVWMSADAKGPYTLKIVPVFDGQNPNEAMQKNSTWFEKKDLRTTTLQYPISAKKFEVGKNYTWSIETKGVWSENFALKIAKEQNENFKAADQEEILRKKQKDELLPLKIKNLTLFGKLYYNSTATSEEIDKIRGPNAVNVKLSIRDKSTGSIIVTTTAVSSDLFKFKVSEGEDEGPLEMKGDFTRDTFPVKKVETPINISKTAALEIGWNIPQLSNTHSYCTLPYDPAPGLPLMEACDPGGPVFMVICTCYNPPCPWEDDVYKIFKALDDLNQAQIDYNSSRKNVKLLMRNANINDEKIDKILSKMEVGIKEEGVK